MKIIQDIELVDLAIYFKSNLVISDIHIGYEEALNKQGVLVPRVQFDDIIRRMEKIFLELNDKNIEKIIINGDLKHEFGAISEQEWRNTLKFLDLLAKRCNEIILIKGNHDNILGPIAKKRNIKIAENVILGGVLIAHGDKLPQKELLNKISTIIIGHEHPAISLKESSKTETYKCFLKGKYKGKNLIVQPSFNPLAEGANILRDKLLSPFLKQGLDNFKVYIVEDKIYDFGRLGKLKRKMN